MNNQKEICTFFKNILDDIDNIMNNNFYENKYNMDLVKEKVEVWYSNFEKEKVLKNIKLEDLEYIQNNIDEIFDEYISSESVKENYVERLSYDFSNLKHLWKDEISGSGTI